MTNHPRVSGRAVCVVSVLVASILVILGAPDSAGAVSLSDFRWRITETYGLGFVPGGIMVDVKENSKPFAFGPAEASASLTGAATAKGTSLGADTEHVWTSKALSSIKLDCSLGCQPDAQAQVFWRLDLQLDGPALWALVPQVVAQLNGSLDSTATGFGNTKADLRSQASAAQNGAGTVFFVDRTSDVQSFPGVLHHDEFHLQEGSNFGFFRPGDTLTIGALLSTSADGFGVEPTGFPLDGSASADFSDSARLFGMSFYLKPLPDSLTPVPEPTTLLFFGTTAVGLGLARCRRNRRNRPMQDGQK